MSRVKGGPNKAAFIRSLLSKDIDMTAKAIQEAGLKHDPKIKIAAAQISNVRTKMKEGKKKPTKKAGGEFVNLSEDELMAGRKFLQACDDDVAQANSVLSLIGRLIE